MDRMSSTPPNLLRVRVSIVGSEPLIWRQLEVDTSLRLDEFHDVLQLVFGWRDSHLHKFTDSDPWERRRTGSTPPRTWGMETPFADDFDEEELPEKDWTLAQVFDGFDGPLFYEYDFGDGWVHQIELIERIRDTNAPLALLLRADRRGPLEDSGGIGGYAEKLEILADPSHPEHQSISEWVKWINGPWTEFDPEAVDVESVNAALSARFGAPAPRSTRSSG